MAFASKPTLAISIPYGGKGREDLGKAYNDIKELGNKLDFNHPIKSVTVYWGSVIDGIEVTYQLSNKQQTTKMHGAYKGAARKTEIQLSETENIVEVSGIHGLTHDDLDFGWGDQITLLSFKIYDSRTGYLRETGTMGVGDHFNQEYRRDILVVGPLAGLAGISNNCSNQVGLNRVQFYTRTPA